MAKDDKKAQPKPVGRKANNKANGAAYLDAKHDNFVKTSVQCDDCDLPLMVFKGKEPTGYPKRIAGSCFGCLVEQPIIVPPGDSLADIVVDEA